MKAGGTTKKTYDSYKSKTATITVNSSLDKNTKTLKEILDAKTQKKFSFTTQGSYITMTPMTQSQGGMFVNGRWKPITMAANGGSFNEGQLFVARERGPELVGQVGGHTAVMNNDQIVASVSDGVYKAVMSAMSGRGETPVIISLEGDMKKLFRAMQTEAKNFTSSTGRPAFAV